MVGHKILDLVIMVRVHAGQYFDSAFGLAQYKPRRSILSDQAKVFDSLHSLRPSPEPVEERIEGVEGQYVVGVYSQV